MSPTIWTRAETTRRTLVQYITVVGVISAVTVAAFLFTPFIGPHATALVYLMIVVILAVFVGRGPTLLAATLSALSWDFFFLPPIYAFRITHVEDALHFGMYFVVALVLGQLTTRIRAQEEAEREREKRSRALYLLTHDLSEATDLDQMLQKISSQMEQVFKAETITLLAEVGDRDVLQPPEAAFLNLPELDRKAAEWAFANGRPAGHYTEDHAAAERLYVPLVASGGVIGVLGLSFKQESPLSARHRNLLDAFSQQIALALDRRRLRLASEKSKLVAESERLSKLLLNCMSHEMRTPLAAIKSAVEYLAWGLMSGSQKAVLAEVEEATDRLNRLVGNVLDMTRLESALVKPKFALCDVRDLVQVSVRETRRTMARHSVTVDIAAGMPLVRMDFVLMQQALMNLLSNAAAHTPAGTEVRIGAVVEGGTMRLSVADRGPGVSSQEIGHIFDKFYRATNAPTGGTGLGLSVVKGFMEAQGGWASAENCAEGGLAVVLYLPLGDGS